MMPSENRPSEKATSVLKLIQKALKASKGEYGPSIRELATDLGVCIGSVQGHLRRLQRDGYVVILPKVPRGIRLTKAGERV